MSDTRYMPREITNRIAWMEKFARTLPEHGPVLNLTPEEIAGAQADARFIAATLTLQQQAARMAHAWTSFRNEAMYGTDHLTQWPGAFAVPEGVPAVRPAGAMRRITKLVGRLKVQPNYTDVRGLALGVVGVVRVLTPADLAKMQPVLRLKLVSAGHPIVIWKKKGMTGIDLEVDRGDGKGFVYLTFDMEPDHLDMSPLPSAGQTAIWTYRGIYRKGDTRVGQWSNETKITVTGI
jgi:hypothetical protein